MPNLTNLSAEKLKEIKAALTPQEKEALFYRWRAWARRNQVLPDGDWLGWLILAGRGFGKTRSGSEAVRELVESERYGRIGLVAETSADGKDVMVNGESGLIACSPPWFMPTFISSNSSGRPKLTWPNGAIATLYDAREPDQLRGPQHDLIWFDELAKYRYADAVFDQAMFGLRLGDDPRWIATTTPRPISLIKRLLSQSGVIVTRGKSAENMANIAASYRANVIDRYRGTRLGRQELDAEVLEDVPGALWTRRLLDENRVNAAPQLPKLIIGVDPATTNNETSNETGIIVGGMAENGHSYVLEDWSARGTPDQWARKVVAAYRKYNADYVVAEANQGGQMVEMVIKSVADIPVRLVHASRGKYIRAEPISALYEQGRVHHVGMLPELEDQMIAFTPERVADRSDGISPDRVDALVWMLSDLFPAIAARDKPEPPRIPAYRNADPGMGVLG
ncbi:MAG: DNA-packaging protein [Patescibacteria group bacterium]|nr:DNA-packaging protein [Patescibacteria group bacterium]